MVIKGDALDALSDDPTELQNELQALAGPAAVAPTVAKSTLTALKAARFRPKSDILEIRVNQKPVLRRIRSHRLRPHRDHHQARLAEISYKAASADTVPTPRSAPPTRSLAGGAQLLSVFVFWQCGWAECTKTSSYFFNAFTMSRQSQSIVVALDPATLSNLSEAFPAPTTLSSTSRRASIFKFRRTTS